jgi:type I restriction enzyme M protein
VQKEIVAEIEGYQKVIDGARAVLDHYRPHIPIRPEWPTAKLEEVLDTITPPLKILKTDFSDKGKYPIIDQSQNTIAGRTDDSRAVIDAAGGLVIFGDHTCAVKYVEEPFAQGADGIKIIKTHKRLAPKFLYFYLISNPIQTDGYKRHFGKLKESSISLPPLATQREIVEEIEAEQALVNANHELIVRMEKKIQAVLTRVWGDDIRGNRS